MTNGSFAAALMKYNFAIPNSWHLKFLEQTGMQMLVDEPVDFCIGRFWSLFRDEIPMKWKSDTPNKGSRFRINCIQRVLPILERPQTYTGCYRIF